MTSHIWLISKVFPNNCFISSSSRNSGFVFKVTSLGENLPYALKVINDVNTEEDFEVFSQEAKLHSKMSHPNIIKLNNSFLIKKENSFVLQQELADCSLASEIKALPKKTAMSYFTQMMEALRYLHDDLHIVHRDLKPSNILIKQGVIKLCDMGEAKPLSKKMLSLSTSRDFGTRIYLPPEVLNGNEYNEKSDIWAAGVVFHEMLSKGKHPFDLKGTHQQAEIIENVKSRNGKFNECIHDSRSVAILESTFIFLILCILRVSI